MLFRTHLVKLDTLLRDEHEVLRIAAMLRPHKPRLQERVVVATTTTA